MSCLITGGCGFIGSWLVERLLQEGYQIIVYDNFKRFSPDNLGENRSKVSLVQGNILDFETLRKAVSNCSIVFHLAAESRVGASFIDPRPFFETNVIGTYSVLEACRLADAKCIFPSSYMVYDKNAMIKGKPVSEEDKVSPVTHYGLSKLAGEFYCDLFKKTHGLDNAILRLSNVYGPSDKGRLIPTFIGKAKKGEPLTIFGKKRVLNFIYVTDVIEAMLLASTNNNANGEAINIGTEFSVTLEDLANLIVRECRSSSQIVYKPAKSWEYCYYLPDTTKAERLLGFKARVNIDTGIRSCVEWY